MAALDRAALAADPRNGNAKLFPAIAKRLLEAGAEMTARAAAALADAPRIRELVGENPALLREISRNGGLLTLAVKHGHLEIVRLLLDLGADVDERVMLEELEEPMLSWGTPLWYAALAEQRDIAELLLDRGADPNANVYASGWPLRNAWGHKDDSVKRLLLEQGAKAQPYMVACSKRAEALDAGHNGELSSINTGDGVDDLNYSPTTHILYVGAAKDGRLTVARVDATGKLSLIAVVPTHEGARNGVVTKDGTVYLAHSQLGQLSGLIVVSPTRQAAEPPH